MKGTFKHTERKETAQKIFIKKGYLNGHVVRVCTRIYHFANY